MEIKIKQIKKRDDSIVNFEQGKITQALFKALKAVGREDEKLAQEISDKVVQNLNNKFHPRSIPAIEEIQDIVEEVLIKEGLFKAAKAYIIYREQHARLREMKKMIDSHDVIEGYLKQLDWRVKENANMAYSLQGLNNHVASAISSHYWLNKIYPPEIRDAHLDGTLHIHDLQLLAVYCCGWDLQGLLRLGFSGVEGKVHSKPAKHFKVALGQVVNFLYTLQGEAAGAEAFANFDTLLAPFIRSDGLDEKRVKQAMQEFVFNMNVPTRVGFQTPFSNLTFDLTCPSTLANEPVIIGGLPQKETYKEFQKEMDLINKTFAEVMIEGDAKGRVFTFPIPTYNISKDFDWDNKVLDPVWEMTAKYGIPYFANFINSEMKVEDARSMCLSPKEEVLVRNNVNIKRLNFGQLIEKYKKTDFDNEGWADCDLDKNLELISLNLQTGKTEWAKVKKFLKVKDTRLIQIITQDGKEIKVSAKHIIPVFTQDGIVNRFAEDIKENDYLLNLKNTDGILNDKYQKIEDMVLTEDFAKILGFFIADGNYLFESRKNLKTFGQPRGLQFTFNAKTGKDLADIRQLIQKVLPVKVKEKKDARYNTYYLYIYNTQLARKLFRAGFKKYGRLPDIIFNSPQTVIESFLNYHFRGDGYEKRKEIHINDKELAHDLVILYSLVGYPVTYRKRKKSQIIYIQHKKGKINKKGVLNTPLILQRLPGFLAKSTYLVPGLNKSRMVGIETLNKYNAHTENSLNVVNSNYYIVRIKEIKKKIFTKPRIFFDVELEKNHLFVHSLGTITHNCCRLRLDNRELRRRGGGLFAANPLTGSIGVVTINLSRLGYLSRTQDAFFNRLGQVMDLARSSLKLKREILEDFTSGGLYPYSRFYLQDIKERFGQYWRNHFNTIGINGMNEAMLNFINRPLSTKEGKAMAEKTMDFMLQRLAKYQQEDDQLYNLEATPAEGATYRFARKDKELYPDIVVANEEDYQERGAAPYYTNSTHLPVDFSSDIFEILEHQDSLQVKYTGGTVIHNFLGERLPDIESAKQLIRKIAENFHLPYYTLTPTFSICPKHGYLSGEHRFCPICDEEIGFIREESEKLPL